MKHPNIPQKTPSFPEPQIHSAVLGREAVIGLNEVRVNELNAAAFRGMWAQAQELSAKKARANHTGTLWRKLGRLAGSVMTEPEEQFLDYAIDHYYLGDYYDMLADARTQETAKHLSAVSARLRDLKPEQNNGLDAYCETFAPAALRDEKHESGAEDHWSEWLTKPANDSQFVSFLQWHVYALEEQQTDPEAQAEIEVERELFKLGVASGLADKWLHPDAVEAISSVDSVQVYIGDIFDTILNNRGGYHIRDTNLVIIAGATTPDTPDNRTILHNIRHAAKHEFNHARLGRLGMTWMDEALTEHIVRVMETGQPEVIEPKQRSDEGSYPEVRALLGVVLGGPNKNAAVPVSLATRAYSERSSNETAVRLMDEIETAWGVQGGIDKINARMHKLQTSYEMKGHHSSKALAMAANKVRKELLNPERRKRLFGREQASLQVAA